jgi:hypothetical protein
VAVVRRFGLLGDGKEHSYRTIDPARSEKSNREAVVRGVAALRVLLADGD